MIRLTFFLNLLYAAYHGFLGIYTRSLWLLVLSAYYSVLSALRFGVLAYYRKSARQGDRQAGIFCQLFSGILLVVLALVLAVAAYLSTVTPVGKAHHLVVMISIAIYTFYKTILAIVCLIRDGNTPSPYVRSIRNINCADGAAAMFSLQRSMFATFGPGSGRIMNITTGCGVCLLVGLLGLSLVADTAHQHRKEV